jgi:uncharacterized repeat protein (TIGR03806 family)
MRGRVRVWVAALAAVVSACGSDGESPDVPDAGVGPVVVDVTQPPPERLSSYRFFTWSPATGFAFNDGVVPYDLNAALFSDYALKQRAIYVPPGTSATYDGEQAFGFPVGSVLIKNFYFAADMRAPDVGRTLVETRLLVRHPDGWHPLPYIWDAAQEDAVLSPAGEVRAIPFVDADGEPQVASYLIPQRNQCEACHARKETATSPLELVAIGTKARHLNRPYDYGAAVGTRNQLEYLAERGMLSGLPALEAVPAAYDFQVIEAGGVAAIPPADVDAAARSYLDIGCAHCHNPQGVQGVTSQLFLDHANADPFRLGVCKRPGSAGSGTGGFTFDIVPGSPDTSILYFRTATAQVGAMMPLLGRSLTHKRGAELLHAWIAAMPPDDCDTPSGSP